MQRPFVSRMVSKILETPGSTRMYVTKAGDVQKVMKRMKVAWDGNAMSFSTTFKSMALLLVRYTSSTIYSSI